MNSRSRLFESENSPKHERRITINEKKPNNNTYINKILREQRSGAYMPIKHQLTICYDYRNKFQYYNTT